MRLLDEKICHVVDAGSVALQSHRFQFGFARMAFVRVVNCHVERQPLRALLSSLIGQSMTAGFCGQLPYLLGRLFCQAQVVARLLKIASSMSCQLGEAYA